MQLDSPLKLESIVWPRTAEVIMRRHQRNVTLIISKILSPPTFTDWRVYRRSEWLFDLSFSLVMPVMLPKLCVCRLNYPRKAHVCRVVQSPRRNQARKHRKPHLTWREPDAWMYPRRGDAHAMRMLLTSDLRIVTQSVKNRVIQAAIMRCLLTRCLSGGFLA